MNKSVFSVLLVAMLGMCSLNAGETISQEPATSLQKQDMELLFGANADAKDLNVAVLSEEELKGVQGEFWKKVLDFISDKIFREMGGFLGNGIGETRY
ncbi:hypothetical protein ACWIWK_03010 [Helicobacter sp. 23-1048]